MCPVEFILLPALEGHASEQVGGCGLIFRRIQIKTGHHGYVDDMTTQVALRCGQLFVGKRTKSVIFITTTHGDTDDGHPCVAGLVNQTIDITTTKQLTEKNEDISLSKDILCGYFAKRAQLGHMLSCPWI